MIYYFPEWFEMTDIEGKHYYKQYVLTKIKLHFDPESEIIKNELDLTTAFEEFLQSYKDECKDLEVCQIVDFLFLMHRDFQNDQKDNNI